MEIYLINTKEDYIDFFKIFQNEQLRKKSAIFILIPFFFGFVLGGNPFEWLKFCRAVVISEICLFLLLYLLPHIRNKRRIEKSILNNSAFYEKKKIAILEEGLSVESERSSKIIKWESILSTQSIGKYIYLEFADKSIFIIPKRFFLSDIDALNFIGLIQKSIIKVRGTLNIINDTKSKKSHYILGLFCIVPIIGGIIGVILLLHGIFKYKDKWLVFIGIGGIIITLGFFYFLNKQLDHESKSNDGLILMSQSQLNHIMKDVEFYKVQHGTYPDKLEQIYNTDLNVITDPILSLNIFNMNTRFNYQKIGDKYLLFSSGVDKKPHTKDDLYPTILSSDSSNFGIIRENIK